jgi:hypothetical protein
MTSHQLQVGSKGTESEARLEAWKRCATMHDPRSPKLWRAGKRRSVSWSHCGEVHVEVERRFDPS